MKKLLLAFAILASLVVPVRAQYRSDTCRVFIQIYDYTGAPARGLPVEIRRVVLPGSNLATPGAGGLANTSVRTDPNGVAQFRAVQNSTVWLYAQAPGLDTLPVTGRPIAIGSAAVQWIVPTTAGSVPPRYIVAAGQLQAGASVGTVAGTDTLLVTGSGAALSRSGRKLTVNVTGGSGDTSNIRPDMWTRMEQTDTALAGERNRRDKQQADSIALRISVAQLTDSLLALRAQAAALYATLSTLAGYKDTATRAQQMDVRTAYTPFYIGPQTVANTSSNLFEWQPWDSLAVYAKWSMQLITQTGAVVPNNDGLSSQSMSLGFNPNGMHGTGNRKHGMWLKFENHYDYGYAAAPNGPIMETHFEYLGHNGATRRTWTAYNAESSGRGTHHEFGYDRVMYSNGNGVSPAHTDSIAIDIQTPNSNSGARAAGTIHLFDTQIGWNIGATTKRRLVMLANERVDSSGLGAAPILTVEDYGTDHLVLGSPNGRSNARGDFSRVSMYARGIGVTVNDIASEVVFSGARSVRRERGMFGLLSIDTLDLATRNYVDVLVASRTSQTAFSAHVDSVTADRATWKAHAANTSNPHSVTAAQVLPTQTGNAGKFLTTDGSNTSWAAAGGAGPDSNRMVFKDISPNMGATAWKIGTTNTTDSAIGINQYTGPYRIGFTPNGANGPRLTINGPGEGFGPLAMRMGYGVSNAQGEIGWNVTSGLARENTNYSAYWNKFANDNTGLYGISQSGTAGYIYFGQWRSGAAKWMLGIRTAAPWTELDVTGRIRCTDTLRIGDYSTYSYIIPGGALVQSSTRGVKKNIREASFGASLFSDVLAVNPVRYNFKSEVMRSGISDTLKGTERKKAIDADSLRAESLSKIEHVGFIAEDWVKFGGNGKDISQSDIIAVMWRTNQELIKRVQDLEARVAKLEKK